MKRVPQPPINPSLRDLEQHGFWSGFAVAVAGVALLVSGARHVTHVETVDEGTAWETQLVRSFTSGGLKFPVLTPPPPPASGDPESLDRWAKQQASFKPPTWKVRVDPEAKTPCPT